MQPTQLYVKRGRRLFAVPRPQGLADRIAAHSNTRGNWPADDRCSGRARVVNNMRR